MPLTYYGQIYDAVVSIIESIEPDEYNDVKWKCVNDDISLHQIAGTTFDDSRYFQIALGPECGQGGLQLGEWAGSMMMGASDWLLIRTRYVVPSGQGSGDAWRRYVVASASDFAMLIHHLTPHTDFEKWRPTNVVTIDPVGAGFVDESNVEMYPYHKIVVLPIRLTLTNGPQSA